MRNYFSRYRLRYLMTLLYMLQTSGYHTGDYKKWVRRTSDFGAVMKRQSLKFTRKMQLLVVAMTAIVLMALAVTVALAVVMANNHAWWLVLPILALIVTLPYLAAFLIVIPLWVGEKLVQGPRQRAMVRVATAKATALQATVIAIAGSYGKTTFKETLRTILSQSHNVAATPGNKNTVLGTSQFISTLSGDEDIVIFELGESHVGDVAELCALTQPDIGVITGINEAHLETFGSLENTVGTIFELQDYLGDKPVYKNAESQLVADRAGTDDPLAYSKSGVNGWKVSGLETSLLGTKFTAKKGTKVVQIESELIGEHQVGPLVACIDIADRLGMSTEAISEGVRNTKAFEHRMQPLQIGGATVIDDTYNGNIDGIRSGLDLLSHATATRKIYVTPGLVEQGDKTQALHEEIGQKIGEICDVVVLMENSVTGYIKTGLERAGYKGELLVVDDPLRFYQNLDQFVAHGDVVLMQNDWTDNYK